jgi:hypothetical protein
LGDSPLRIESEEDNSQERVGEVSKHKSTTQFVKTGKEAEEDPVEQERALIRAIWQSAPSLSSILDTVKIAAQNWTPSEIGFIRAAIASRKKNPKTEYVRGFGDLLKKTHGFTLTPQLMKAMALTATVVITDKDLVVTYDDVRKALQNKGENSSNE